MATLDILYFAWVREGVGRDAEQIERPAPDVTVAELISSLADRGGGYAEVLGDRQRLRAALDQRFVPLETPIGEAKELAIFPPVTGG
ncbi:Molybdenum cofactor biosynthesis protein MoaD [Sphingobium herbicidovorans NBRC 16415]|uniref:Molybdopterin synthase sulfur carrier subunit n=1 Tax=Sphingobium herbicidovorans (strain ATCC 700291 / DSM 11019 / CCUG 56400 / KCTC 2939 / LMG 18315 / NBRC 16415 / MH) TaxID=1219045 RepID=A0A086PFI2_SPHHM|nr:molybdopterin converting factor subunit 1 [Sphingobium herbicidovorans]KFG92150.1 Molybdenum cofactor biosynthesis protein MoaD [Sphingobium herbicidovorans NBRC 16415]